MRWCWGLLAVVPALVSALASTDSIQDADRPQSGHLPNHNMDPNIVGGDSFGQLWSYKGDNNDEKFYAKPLVYTMDGVEMVITASTTNTVRVFKAKTGELLHERQLQPPFLQSDIGCYDIPDYIGVIGTPIIDPGTSIIYMMSKGYKNGAASGGVANGIYQMFALQLPGLENAPGFPVLIDGSNADNDPARYFVGGTVLQRPALTEINGVIVVGFGGHCDQYNYTGYVISVSKTPTVGVVSMYAMEAAPGAPSPQPLDIHDEDGGKAGIWHSGMGIATDTNRVFVVTGNGQGKANGNVPASGFQPLSTLDECVVNLAVSSEGVFSLTDYFEPYEYDSMDKGDKDLGSSGTCLLDPGTFKTSTISRMAVTVGKNAKVYVMNADNLGGFKQGPGGTDGIIQTIVATNSVFGGVGSYPLEGGYFYYTPVGDTTYAYKFTLDSSGKPFFILAGRSPDKSTGRVGVGQPTITSLNGSPGTGILWVTDVGQGLRAYKAVPEDGVLVPIPLPPTPGINKFQRPAFGDGRLYVTSQNKLICLGYPVNLPLNCTSPVSFGQIETGSSKTSEVSCTANIAIVSIDGCNSGDPSFECDSSELPTGPIAQGETFSFPVTWNLAHDELDPVENVTFPQRMPGAISTAIELLTTNAVEGYAEVVPISLGGTIVSSAPYLFVSPPEVDFGGLVLGTNSTVNGLEAAGAAKNLGNSTLTFTGFAWQDANEGEADGSYNNLTYGPSSVDLGLGFTATNFPAVGDSLLGDETFAIPLQFNASEAGNYAVLITLWSDGGMDQMILTASAGSQPIASIEISKTEGGWDNSNPLIMDFGEVPAGTEDQIRQVRICNSGGSALKITKSKAPVGAQLRAVRPFDDLAEGLSINVGTCAYGDVALYPGSPEINHPSISYSLLWTFNTDGLNALDPSEPFGAREVQVKGTIVQPQVGPLLPNGQARYQYVGCFQDTEGRNLANQVNNKTQGDNNTNEQCQQLCFASGYIFAGTEYHRECWCGNEIKRPESLTEEEHNFCAFSCQGDESQSCGGDGGYISLYADQTRFDIEAFLSGQSGGSSSSSSVASSTTGSVGSSSPVSASSTLTTSSTSSTLVPTQTLNPDQPSVVNNQWMYIGCYKDLVSNIRTLPDGKTASDDMTLEKCATFCSSGAYNGLGFNFFGTEYGRECYCGFALNTTARTSELDCSTKCKGNTTQFCGAGSRLSIFNNTVFNEPPPTPKHVPTAGIYEWIGCYVEATAGRALSGDSFASDSMTVESCAEFCATGGFAMMGLEYSRECYCGNALGAGSVVTATSECKNLCKGNAVEFCGAGGRLDMYSLAASSSSSTTGPSTSSSASTSVGGISSSNTVLSISSSFVEDTSASTSPSTSDAPTSAPSSISEASTSTSASTIASTPSSTPSPSTTPTPASPTSTSTLPTPTPTYSYYHIGCYRDTSPGHALPHMLSNNSITPELCLLHAHSLFSNAPPTITTATLHPFVYVEYHHECYAGATLDFKGSAVTSLVGSKACTDYCYGSVFTSTLTDGAVVRSTDLANRCGGAGQFDLYALETGVEFPTTGGPVVTVTA